MRVLRARAYGFCFGVRDAIQTARHLTKPEATTVFGELVHNDAVLRELKDRGFAMENETHRQAMPPTPNVLITAHGVSDRVRRRLEEAGRRLIDTTCPLVRRAHRAALQLHEEGRRVLVVGRRGHVEVEGLTGDLERFDIVETPADVRSYPEQRLGVVFQTTTPPDRAEDILAAIHERNPEKDIRSMSTICQPTRERQAALLELVGHVDILVVVGGHNSNNTRALVMLARGQGVPCLHIQGPEDVTPGDFRHARVAGLTAGTSTPDEVIEAVEQRLLALESAGSAAARASGALG